jgi:hypothetical protein
MDVAPDVVVWLLVGVLSSFGADADAVLTEMACCGLLEALAVVALASDATPMTTNQRLATCRPVRAFTGVPPFRGRAEWWTVGTEDCYE